MKAPLRLQWIDDSWIPVREWIDRLLASPITWQTAWARREVIDSPLSLRDVDERREQRRRRRAAQLAE